ncbi:MAG: cytochrome P450 [Pseudomonadales bacterium]|nr:cytochrome P450 [Pseudomonadales bacterium]
MNAPSISAAQQALLQKIAALPKRPETNLDHIPGDYGWPLVGHSFSILKDARSHNARMIEKYGTIYRSSAFTRRQVMFADADAAQYLLMDQAQNFSSERGWMMVREFLGGGILLRDFADHRKHRRPLQQAFKSKVMNAYCHRLNGLISQGLANWPRREQFLFQPAVKSLLLDNAASVFLGSELGRESDKLNQSFVDMLGGIAVILQLRIPGTAYNRAVQGTQYLRNWLARSVGARKQSDSQDIFTSLCHLAEDPANELSVEDIVSHTLLIWFAAHDTTTSSLCSMMTMLGEHPEWQEEVRRELLALDDGGIGFDQTADLDITDRVFRETLRQIPPVLMIPRRAIDAFEYRGFQIPANSAVAVLVDHIHHSEQYWSNPGEFDPDRWLPQRAEHKKHPFQWIPFGGGAHKCLGFKFADMQVKVFLYHLLRNYRIETLREPGAGTRYVPIPLPNDQLPVRLLPL